MRPTPSHSTAAPATMADDRRRPGPARGTGARTAAGGPRCGPSGASRPRSWTWFSAEAPQDSSITPASTSRPCAQGNSGPSGARSMKPAPAETSTRSTMPNFESSA